MSINTDNDGISDRYLGNGITVNFPFNFKIFENTEIIVKKTSATGVITTLTFGTDYTVNINANQDNNPGGQITLPIALPTGNSLVIISNVSYTQKTVLTSQGNFDPQVLNNVHDKAVILTQQLKGKFETALKVPDSDGTAINTVLPAAITRAGKALVFQTDGSVGLSSANYEDSAASAAASAATASAAASTASTANSDAQTAKNAAAISAASANSYAYSASTSADNAAVYASSVQWRAATTINTSTGITDNFSGYMFVVNTSSGNISINVPPLAGLRLPFILGFKKQTNDTNSVIISPNGTDTIDGLSNKILPKIGNSTSLIATSSGWFSVDSGNPNQSAGAKSVYYCGLTTTSGQVWSVFNGDITSLYDGLIVQVRFNDVVSNQTSLNLNGYGAKAILSPSGVFIANSLIANTVVYTLVYYNNVWQITDVTGFDPIRMRFASIEGAMSNSVASAATTNIWSNTGNTLHITGASSISSLGTPPQAGAKRLVVFDGAATLVHSANLILPSGANIITAAGDSAIFLAESTSVVRCVNYTRASGNPVNNNLSPRVDVCEQNIALLSLRSQIDTGWSVLNMVDGIADKFQDQTGIDAGLSSNYRWDDAENRFLISNEIYTDQFTGGTPFGDSSQTQTAPPSYAFDNNWLTYWMQNASLSTNILGYYFPSGTTKIIKELQFWRSPQTNWLDVFSTFSVQASLDNTTWATLASNVSFGTWQKPQGLTARRNFGFSNNTAYRYYRVVFSGGQALLAELRGGSIAPSNMIVTSQAFSAIQAPVESRLVLLYQPADTSTLNTDCTLEVSRNNGTSWASAPLVYEGMFDSSTQILSAVTSLESQSSGTSLRYRIKTFNNKAQRFSGVWMQWR